MKKIALVAVVLGMCALPACSTFNPQRRTLTDWTVSRFREPADPCGNMPGSAQPKSECRGNPEKAASTVIDNLLVKPITFVMIPIAWVGDTFILNPINGWKKAELQTYERRFCRAEEEPTWSDAHAASEAGGAIPIAVPWVVSDVLAVPEFAGHFVWNTISPTDPVKQDAYNAYWNEHNEKQPR